MGDNGFCVCSNVVFDGLKRERVREGRERAIPNTYFYNLKISSGGSTTCGPLQKS